MKIKITILVLTLISLYSCNSEKNISVEDAGFDKYFSNKENVPVVKGRVLNLTPEEIQKTELAYSLVTPFEQTRFQIQKNGNLNNDGTFELEIDNAFPYQQIWLHVGELFYAGLYANSELYIELNADSLRNQRVYMNGPGVTYSGKDGELNTFMNNHILYKAEEWRKTQREINELGRKRKLEYSEFKIKYDSLYSILFKIDDGYIQENPSDYSWLLKNERMSDYYSSLCVRFWNSMGPQMSDSLFEEIKNHKCYTITNNSAGFYNYLFTFLKMQSTKGHQKDFLNFRNYSKLTEADRALITEYDQIDKQIKENMPFDKDRHKELSRTINAALSDTLFYYNTSLTINYIDSIFDAPKADLLKMKLSSRDLHEEKIIMEEVLKSIHTNWCRTVIQERYNENQAKLESIEKALTNSKPLDANTQFGTPIEETPFGAKLYKVDSMYYQILLANLKTANKNKALIIDFWATWCAPCLAEMPYSKKLHNEVKDLPVEFIYLCTSSNSDVEKWKSKIAEFELSGTHIFVDQKIENDLMSLFSAGGFPTYVFIDKNGEYKAGAISRMSNLNKDKLAELLK